MKGLQTEGRKSPVQDRWYLELEEGLGREQTPPHRTLRYDPDLEANEGWKGECEQGHYGKGGTVQAKLSNSGRTPPCSLMTLPAPPWSSRWSPKGPRRPHQPLSTQPWLSIPAGPVLSVSRSLLEKWRRQSCPINRSVRTFTAHAQRASRRALRYRSAPLNLLLPFSPSYLRARSKDSLTSFNFIYPATTLTPRNWCFTDKY